MIDERLQFQEATRQSVSAQAEIDAELTKLADRNGVTLQTFGDFLARSGVTYCSRLSIKSARPLPGASLSTGSFGPKRWSRKKTSMKCFNRSHPIRDNHNAAFPKYSWRSTIRPPKKTPPQR